MRKREIVFVLVCALLLGFTTMAAAMGAEESASAERTISFYSGSPGGGWYPMAVAISEAWNKDISGLSFTHADAGGAGNLVAINAGKADVAISTTASIGDAVKGNPPFEVKVTKMQALAAFNPEYYTLFVWKSSGIEKLTDLKGKRLVPLPRGYTTEVLTRSILATVGMTYDDFAKVDHVHLSEAVNLMKDGHIDAMANAFSFKGDPNITELSIYKPIRALDIPADVRQKVRANNPGISEAILPKGSYNGIDEDVHVLGFALALAINADLPEDLVYQMTKALVENWDDIKLVSESFAAVEVKDMANPDVGVEFHPGAAKYYKEQGWLK